MVKNQYGIECFGAILSETTASIDAYKLAHELIQLNVQRGMQVYDQTDIKQFNLSNDKPFVVTESGCIIHCKKVIFCSGFETTKLVKEKVAKLFYTYACVSVQNPRVLTPCHHDDLNVKMNWEWGSALPVFPLSTFTVSTQIFKRSKAVYFPTPGSFATLKGAK